MWVFDVDRHAVWWANRRGLEFWRAETLEDLVARDFGSDGPSVRERLSQIVSEASGTERSEDTWTLYPKGLPVVVTVAYQPLRIEGARDGILIELLRTADNFADTQSWRMVEATRATPLMITSCTAEGRILSQNPAATACFGAPEAARTIDGRFVDPAGARKMLRAALQDRSYSRQMKVRTTAGEDVHLVSPVRARDPVSGDVVIVLSEMKITDLALAMEAQASRNTVLQSSLSDYTRRLQRSEERYARALETASIWEWDVERDRLYLSPNFAAALGYAPNDLVRVLREGRFPAIIDPRDAEACREAFAAHKAGFDVPFSIEARVLSKSGVPIWFSFQGKHYCDAAGRHVRTSGLLVDISARKSLEEQLLSSQRLEAVGQLTGGIAHDFNNLLTVIQGNAELLLAESVFDPELAQEIVTATQKGAQMTRHLLAFARKQALKPGHVDLRKLIPAMRNTLLRALGEAVEVRFALAEDLFPVHVDATQLEAAVLNLALNARDAMPSGGVISIDCRTLQLEGGSADGDHALEPGAYVAIAVTDSGAGMSPEVALRAFEPFYSTKGVGRGSGLGLSMVLGFSRQSGGDCRIRSVPGNGTVVTLLLPRAPKAEARAEAEALPEPLRGRGEHVHVLEDNSTVMLTVSKTLTALGYRVTDSRTYDAAVRFVESGAAPQLYLLDVILPGGRSGADFARWLDAHRPGSRIVFMSGYPGDHLGETGRVPRDRPLLRKPFGQADLAAALRAALDPRHAQGVGAGHSDGGARP